MKKKLIILMLLLLSLLFIICFNIKKNNVAKNNKYINNIEDNQVIKSENKDHIEESNEPKETIEDVIIYDEEKSEVKEEVKAPSSNSINDNNDTGNNTTNKSNNSSNKNNNIDTSDNSSNGQNNINKNEINSEKSNTDITDNNFEQVTEESEEDEIPSQEEQAEELSDNAVNINHLDYPTHKGRIDCIDYNVCMEESLDFYFKYKKSVLNIYYVEVKSNNGKTLGYFTEYVFKDGAYSNYDECHIKGKEIKNILSDRVTKYMCSSSGTLTIITDY